MWASTRSNGPTRVRRSAVRWPPTPSAARGRGPARGRTYRTDVHLDVEVEHARRRDVAASTSNVHRDRPGRQLDLLPRADPGVSALAVDLDRAHRAGHLQDARSAARSRGAISSAVRPAASAPPTTSPWASSVTVVLPSRTVASYDLSVAGRPSSRVARPDAEDEYAGGHRVERAGVPDLAGAGQPADPGDDVVAGPARSACRRSACRTGRGSDVVVLVDPRRRRPRRARRPRRPSRHGRRLRRRRRAGAVRVRFAGVGHVGGQRGDLASRAAAAASRSSMCGRFRQRVRDERQRRGELEAGRLADRAAQHALGDSSAAAVAARSSSPPYTV